MPEAISSEHGSAMPEHVEALPCDLLVFDLDGTLIDSRQDLANSVNATLAFAGRPPLEERQIATFIGDGVTMLLQRALLATGGTDDSLWETATAFFLGYYREHKLDFTFVYPGVMGALRRMRDSSPLLPMAVLTNKPVGPSTAICDALGLSPFFFRNYGGNSFATKKPDPLGMQALMHEASELLGRPVDPRRTVLVGDSHVDVETARAAGVLSLGCGYGMDADRMHAARPDAWVHAPEEWFDALCNLLRPSNTDSVLAEII